MQIASDKLLQFIVIFIKCCFGDFTPFKFQYEHFHTDSLYNTIWMSIRMRRNYCRENVFMFFCETGEESRQRQRFPCTRKYLFFRKVGNYGIQHMGLLNRIHNVKEAACALVAWTYTQNWRKKGSQTTEEMHSLSSDSMAYNQNFCALKIINITSVKWTDK